MEWSCLIRSLFLSRQNLILTFLIVTLLRALSRYDVFYVTIAHWKDCNLLEIYTYFWKNFCFLMQNRVFISDERCFTNSLFNNWHENCIYLCKKYIIQQCSGCFVVCFKIKILHVINTALYNNTRWISALTHTRFSCSV